MSETEGYIVNNANSYICPVWCGLNLRNMKEYGDIVPCKFPDANGVYQLKSNELPQGYWALGLSEGKWSHFSGAVWLREPTDGKPGIPLVVASKINNLDAVSMFIDVAASSEHATSEGLFGCKTNEPPIEGVVLPDDITLLQVAVYLSSLSKFCQRDLRQGFSHIRENMTGRVKGRILIEENIRKNTVRGRSDRIACEYTRMTIDTPENRILKAALSRCYRYIRQAGIKHYDTLSMWTRQCEAALAEVSLVQVTDNDFRHIRYSGLMQRYRHVHGLGRMIIKRIRTDSQGDLLDDKQSVTLPFYLNMWMLFEHYVGVQLQKTGLNFIPQKSYPFSFELPESMNEDNVTDVRAGSLTIRPDYISIKDGIVVDAKYKCITSELKEEEQNLKFKGFAVNVSPSNSDIYQLIAYSVLLSSEHGVPFKKAIIMAPGIPGENKQIDSYEKLVELGAKLKLNSSLKDVLPEEVFIIPCPVPRRQKLINQ